ncbi:hypothetical protein BSK54_10290 [Paenibacillus odorifer]|uniref:hypothetical protein n=1 Tax=Paenibacillus odorifer TaxID=189426 RepID=UPI00096DEA22|nr:hypothetical protein [Paenibacillus odorifer]OME02638.1 hypothetical protein BSK54_10290 [Paenibacillus odorifer]
MKINKIGIIFLSCIFLFFVYGYNPRSTVAVVSVSEIKENSIVLINQLGEKTKVKVPSRFDTSKLNEESDYFVEYDSSIFRRNTLRKIKESK